MPASTRKGQKVDTMPQATAAGTVLVCALDRELPQLPTGGPRLSGANSLTLGASGRSNRTIGAFDA